MAVQADALGQGSAPSLTARDRFGQRTDDPAQTAGVRRARAPYATLQEGAPALKPAPKKPVAFRPSGV